MNKCQTDPLSDAFDQLTYDKKRPNAVKKIRELLTQKSVTYTQELLQEKHKSTQILLQEKCTDAEYFNNGAKKNACIGCGCAMFAWWLGSLNTTIILPIAGIVSYQLNSARNKKFMGNMCAKEAQELEHIVNLLATVKEPKEKTE